MLLAHVGVLDTEMHIIHLGCEYGVTGSCHLLRAKGLHILVDCGIAQGDDAVWAYVDMACPEDFNHKGWM